MFRRTGRKLRRHNAARNNFKTADAAFSDGRWGDAIAIYESISKLYARVKKNGWASRNAASSDVQHGFYARPAAHLPTLATRAGIGTISRSSNIARFVQGGVVKTFR